MDIETRSFRHCLTRIRIIMLPPEWAWFSLGQSEPTRGRYMMRSFREGDVDNPMRLHGNSVLSLGGTCRALIGGLAMHHPNGEISTNPGRL